MSNEAGGAEEYSQLRTEMTYRFITLQMFLGTTFIGYFTVAGVVFGFALKDSNDRYQALLLATPFLFAIVFVATVLSYDWLRQIYRMGSYLVVFHERPNGHIPKDRLLGWITRNRRPKKPICAQALDHWRGDPVTTMTLLFTLLGLSWLSFAGGIALRPSSWPWSWKIWCIFILSVILTLPILIWLAKLRKTFSEEASIFTEAWEKIRNAENQTKSNG